MVWVIERKARTMVDKDVRESRVVRENSVYERTIVCMRER